MKTFVTMISLALLAVPVLAGVLGYPAGYWVPVVPGVVDDKRIVVVDDSIIRGNTSRRRVRALREAEPGEQREREARQQAEEGGEAAHDKIKARGVLQADKVIAQAK